MTTTYLEMQKVQKHLIEAALFHEVEFRAEQVKLEAEYRQAVRDYISTFQLPQGDVAT